MNISQRQNILNWIEQIEQLNFVDLLNAKYPNEGDAKKIMFGNYNAAQFFQLLKKITTQLKTELNSGLGLLLPQSHNFHNDYGKVNLEEDFNNLYTWLSSSDFDSAVTRIDSLIYYQIINGFWDKSKIVAEKSSKAYEQLVSELTIVEGKLKGFIDKNRELVNSFNQSIDGVNSFLSTKKEEFTVLNSNQQNSNAILQEIQTILADARVKETEIKNISENQTKTQSEIRSESENQKNIFEEYKKATASLTTEQNNLISETTTTLNSVNNKMEEFKQLDTYLNTKKSEIEKLAGFAADSSLGHSFNSRKKQLITSSYIWLTVSILLMVGTGVWLSLVYTNDSLKPHTGNIYFDIVLYAVKSAIAFLILGFAIKQYSKERTLQEEYAFKEAVAVTINAYADQLQGEKDEDRRRMIMNTIEKMYSTPKIHSDENHSMFGFRQKDVKEIVEKVLSEAKHLVP